MNINSEDEFPAKRDLTFRIFLMLEFQMIVVLFYALSPNLIIFWSLFVILLGNLEIISWKILSKPDLTDNRRKFWREMQETPFVPLIVLTLVGMVIVQIGFNIIKDYQIQKEQKSSGIKEERPNLTLRALKKIGLLLLIIILLVLLVIFYSFIFTSTFIFLIKVTGYSVTPKIANLVQVISFILVELALFGSYLVFDNWVKKPHVPDDGNPEQIPT